MTTGISREHDDSLIVLAKTTNRFGTFEHVNSGPEGSQVVRGIALGHDWLRKQFPHVPGFDFTGDSVGASEDVDEPTDKVWKHLWFPNRIM